MKKIKCLITDDEKLAQNVLIHHISKFDFLELKGVCKNVFELIRFLNEDKAIDLIFLDIKMPEINGTDFVNIFKDSPAIIYTTAYNQYALEAFDQSAVDYLMKPVSLERFSKAVHRAQQILGSETVKKVQENSNEDLSFYVKSEKKLIKINFDELVFIEGMRNYVCINTLTDKIIVHQTLTNFESSFKEYQKIVRVHKSFFVNLNHVQFIEQHVMKLTTGTNIPIGLQYRDFVYEKLTII